jgi:hypothetical protein
MDCIVIDSNRLLDKNRYEESENSCRNREASESTYRNLIRSVVDELIGGETRNPYDGRDHRGAEDWNCPYVVLFHSVAFDCTALCLGRHELGYKAGMILLCS